MSDEDQKLETEDWLSSPFTQLAHEQVAKDHAPAILAGLLRICHGSSDPKVTMWLEKYRAALDLETFLKTGELPK